LFSFPTHRKRGAGNGSPRLGIAGSGTGKPDMARNAALLYIAAAGGDDMAWLSDPQAWIALLTLTALEIVLGIDNVIFISILAGKLPADQQKKARNIGLMMAMVMRVLLLLSIAWIVKLTAPLFSLMGHEISGRDLILLGGGLFLIAKATHEIHNKLEGVEGEKSSKTAATLTSVVVQIALLDIVFSLDSVITAVGMAKEIGVMVAAVIIAVLVMLIAASSISSFVDRHPTVKMLALSFLVMIGTALIAEGLEFHIPKGYIYFAMAFSVMVELLNMRLRRGTPVQLHDAYRDEHS
jgi:predicted tellurium resistance membrane protein TerC